MAVTPDLLRKFNILRHLPETTLLELAARSQMKKFARREVVLSKNERAQDVCFLFEGRLQGVDFTIDGREVGLYFVEPGGFCGEITLFSNEPTPEIVISLTPAVVVLIPSSDLRSVMENTPKMMSVVAKKLAETVKNMKFQRSLLALPSVGQQVCCQLWLLVDDKLATNEQKEQNILVISNPPTHMELAIMLSISRETVTRVFQTLQSKQIVRRDGPKRLLVLNPDVLKNLAEGSLKI